MKAKRRYRILRNYDINLIKIIVLYMILLGNNLIFESRVSIKYDENSYESAFFH